MSERQPVEFVLNFLMSATLDGGEGDILTM